MDSTLALAETFRGPIIISVAYILVYYLLMIRLLFLKIRLGREYKARGERFDRYFGQDRVMLAGDRMVLNTLEHMPPFLILLWLHAVFVCPVSATIAGGIYLACRAAYPFLLGTKLGRGVPTRVLPATFSAYAVLLYLSGGLIWAVV
jgi:hypothetical protein